MRLDERAVLQLPADDDVTADRDALPGNDGVDRMALLAKAEVPALVGVEARIDCPQALFDRRRLRKQSR